MRCRLFIASIIICALDFCSAANAAVINGEFETGDLTGWTVAGFGSAQTASFGITPAQGTYQGYIETTGNYTVDSSVVLTSLGVVPFNNIHALGAGTPTNGNGLSQSVTVNAADVLSFDWNFTTSELTEPSTYDDFAFYTINGTPYLLASRNSSTWDTASPPAGFEGQTDWATQTYTFPTAGTYSIGFGTFNVGDAGYNSALLLDSISVPEPGAMALLAIGALALLRQRRQELLRCSRLRLSGSKHMAVELHSPEQIRLPRQLICEAASGGGSINPASTA